MHWPSLKRTYPLLWLGLFLSIHCSTPLQAQTSTRTEQATTLKVAPGSSARALAQSIKPAQATIDQTMVALWLGNPHAFINGNIHNLRRDATVQLPTLDDILLIQPAQARAIIAEQHDLSRAPVQNTAQAPLFPHESRHQGPTLPAANLPASTLSPAAMAAMNDADRLNRALLDAKILKLTLEHYTKAAQIQLTALERKIEDLQNMSAPQPEALARPPAASASTPVTFLPMTLPPETAASAAAPMASETITMQNAAPATTSASIQWGVQWDQWWSQWSISPAMKTSAQATWESLQTWWFSQVQILPWWPLLPVSVVASCVFLLLLILLAALVYTMRKRSAKVSRQGPLPIPHEMANINLDLPALTGADKPL
jgi:FimV-like protein